MGSPLKGLRLRKRKILFVEQFYYPDGWGGAELPVNLTLHLARVGFNVEVICGSDQYAAVQDHEPTDPRLHGIRIRRIPALWRGNIHRAKMLRQLWFYVALVPLLLLRRPPNLFVAQTNPPLAVVLVAAVAKLFRRPCLIIAMDIYPEVLIAHGALRRQSLLGKVLEHAFGWAYRQAQRVVALGPVMAERLQGKGVKAERIVEIPNWATGTLGIVAGSDNKLRAEWDLAGKFVLLYSGNLGLAHEFETFLQGVKRASATDPSLRVLFIGGGSRLAEVRRRVAELAIESLVRFSKLLPAHRLPESFGLAQLAIVTLQPTFAGLVVPSKLQGYMARGLPIMYIGPDSDVERFVIRAAGGVCLRGGDERAVATALVELAGNRERLALLGVNARRFYEAEFSEARALAHYDAAIRSTLDADAAP